MDEFIELVQGLCQRTGMYFSDESFNEVCAYISGYARGAPHSPLGGNGQEAFNSLVNYQQETPGNTWWPYSIRCKCVDDKEAIQRLEELIDLYLTELKSSSKEEILEHYTELQQTRNRNRVSEPEPEALYRKFMIDSITGNEEIISPLILPHKDASVLWERSCSPEEEADSEDVAELMKDQYQEMVITRVCAPDTTEKRVQLLSPVVPVPLTAVKVNGRWRLDVSPIIEMIKYTPASD